MPGMAAETAGSATFPFVGGNMSDVSLYCLDGHAISVRTFGNSQMHLDVLTAAFEKDQVDATLLCAVRVMEKHQVGSPPPHASTDAPLGGHGGSEQAAQGGLVSVL
ncbi:uncharacterized protein J7T54_006720 [Emericellopsis cladophorae]|uniref:Uncharacterized protein n=1 Tax=Emericellopsis cladophorae TaxID=2686198 RepID=A0A9P9Y704_9HYPO|nr:uncharacterized protein J7T54_006720 [Emericellopsis cladophorae]KAI6784674.1 hypothetical protein J7T54_006720 [Emericellopsis cladophorae]